MSNKLESLEPPKIVSNLHSQNGSNSQNKIHSTNKTITNIKDKKASETGVITSSDHKNKGFKLSKAPKKITRIGKPKPPKSKQILWRIKSNK